METLRHMHKYKRGLLILLFGCIIGGVLFGTFNFTLVTLEGSSDCPEKY